MSRYRGMRQNNVVPVRFQVKVFTQIPNSNPAATFWSNCLLLSCDGLCFKGAEGPQFVEVYRFLSRRLWRACDQVASREVLQREQ